MSIVKNRSVSFTEIIAICCENHTEHLKTLCEQKTEFLGVTAGGVNGYTGL